MKESDFESLLKVASDPLIWEQHPDPNRYQRDTFKLFFEGHIKSKSAFLIFDQKTNELIGCTRYHNYDPINSKIEIGYTFLARKYWGGEYNKAMKTLLLNHAFQYVDAVVFLIGSTNIRSQRATMKLGAAKISEQSYDLNGTKMVVYEFEIRKQVWMNKVETQ